MRIEGVVWLNAIVDKLAVRHHVATHEVEEVLTIEVCISNRVMAGVCPPHLYPLPRWERGQGEGDVSG
jgi:hypothetical protein